MKITSQELGDGLLMRPASLNDVEPLAAFQARNMHFPMGFHIREWMRGDHPTNSIDAFTIVEDTRTGEIVSAACLIPQTFQYDGIPVRAGRAEAVATEPAYRRRGLVRAQFAALHARADAQGQLMQAVEGATWLYRRLGYALALENTGGMNSGGRVCFPPQAPRLPEGEQEAYRVRAAVGADLPFVAELYAESRARYLLTSEEPPAHWEYLLRGGGPGYNRWYDLRVVETRVGKPVGFLVHDPWGAGCVLLYEVRPGVSWLAVTPTVLRSLLDECARATAAQGGDFQMLRFCFGSEHPVYHAAPEWLTVTGQPYAGWCLRVPDVVRFLRHAAPALERRLGPSLLSGHSGTLRLNFYSDGARLRLEEGRITEIAPWTPTHERDGDVTLDTATFLRLLFGYRSLDEIQQADADCWVSGNEARVLLSTLFPKQHSHLGPLA
jgi:GNAT superfamily N-acetyltransferase